MKTDELLKTYPRRRKELPEEYRKIYDQHYEENRKGKTKVSSLSSKLEHWMHKKTAKSASADKTTLEIGAGTLNQLNFEQPCVYDIIEPYKKLFQNAPNLKYVRNVYSDITEIHNEKYDRITSIACFEHVENLPEMVAACTRLLAPGGKLYVSIPNEGRFLWKFSYTVTTGAEFKRRFGLDYAALMQYEHINTADEIEQILRYYFADVIVNELFLCVLHPNPIEYTATTKSQSANAKCVYYKISLLGIGKTFSFYRYYECGRPRKRRP